MNILFVSMTPLEYNTSATIQNIGIIKGLNQLGHNVDILTLEVDNSASLYDPTINEHKKYIRDAHYIKMNSYYRRLMSKKAAGSSSSGKSVKTVTIRTFVKKIFDCLSIYDAQKINVRNVDCNEINSKEYDIIISSSDPKSSHLVARRLIKSMRVKPEWIQYWGDPFFADITRTRGIKDILVKKAESSLIKQCDRAVYASPITLNEQRKMYGRYKNKMNFANQAVVEDNILNNNSKNQTLKIGYFGAYMSSYRNIMPFYNAACSDKNRFYYIVGNSDIELKNKDNIAVNGNVSYKTVSEMEKECDILVAVCNTSGGQIPGKIYYMAKYNKPLIIILDGEYKDELKAFFNSFNRYILCDNTPSDIENAIITASECIGKNYDIDYKLTTVSMAEKILS